MCIRDRSQHVDAINHALKEMDKVGVHPDILVVLLANSGIVKREWIDCLLYTSQQQIHQWSDRRKMVDTVLLPMMVFVHVNPKERMEVLSLSLIHICYFLGNG